MALVVERLSSCLIKASENTPSSTLELSVIDRIPVLRCNARTLHVFGQGPGAAKVIKEALSKALAPYYPLSGRLKESVPGELQIECCNGGVRFVEAATSCTLDSVGYFEDVAAIPYDELLPDQYADSDGREPLVQMQITQFACSGFVMGLIFCHSICDGLGAAQFLNAIGEVARAGLDGLTIKPVWHRNFFPSPPSSQSAPPTLPSPPILPPPMPDHKLEHTNIDMSKELITQLKQSFHESTGYHCSTFEVIAATLWRSRTRAINLKHDAEVQLVFFANCREVVDPPLPEGFYGNCFFPVTVKASSQIIQETPMWDVVKLIREAKAKLPVEFAKYMKGEHLEGGNADPFAPPLIYSTLFISEWGRLGFNRVDYGWGPPVHVVPIQGSSIIPVGIMGMLPLPRNGIRLMTWCVKEEHRQALLDHMMKLA